MTNLVDIEVCSYRDHDFKVLYTGMPDGRELMYRINGNFVEAPESGPGNLYFTVRENYALSEYVLSRSIKRSYQPVVLETWFPEERELEEWSAGLEFVEDAYPVQNIKGYTDIRTGKFVEHGEGWQPETKIQEIKNVLGLEEEPNYLFDEDTEFDPRIEW